MESNGTQNEKISKIVGIIAIIAGLAFLGLFVFVAAFTGALLLGTLNALFLGIGFAVFTALFMWKVDTSKNLRKKTQVGKFNLRWLIIALFSLAIIISGFM